MRPDADNRGHRSGRRGAPPERDAASRLAAQREREARRRAQTDGESGRSASARTHPAARRAPDAQPRRSASRSRGGGRVRRQLGVDALAGLTTAGAVLILCGAIAYAALDRHTSAVGVTQTDTHLDERMAPLPEVRLLAGAAGSPDVATIRVRPTETAQPYWGVGAAVTDSSAYLIHGLGATRARRLLTKMFSRSELGLSFVVVPIGGSDYTASARPYTYDDLPAGQVDPDLKHFSIAHDKAWNLPVLAQITKIRPATKLFAVPWTAPTWMKANGLYDNVHQTGGLLPQYYRAFANYLVDFLEAYRSHGVTITAISPENEPNSSTRIPAMSLPTPDQETFIADDLAPAIKTAGLRTQIFGGDVGLPRLTSQEQLAASPAGKDLAGFAWHCYSSPPTVMLEAAEADPRFLQLITECAAKLSQAPTQESVIGSLLSGSSSFVDWNLALDFQGGPVQLPNRGCPGCRGLVTIVPRTRRAILSSQAYVLGQIGHFVTPGALRVLSSDEPTFLPVPIGAYWLAPGPGLLNVAFRNPDGQLVLIVDNSHGTVQHFTVSDGHDHFTTALPPGAMATYTWRDRAATR